MIYDKNPPPWESEDAVAMKTFLESEHGKRFISRLAWQRPEYSPTFDTTKRLVESGEIRGYEKCIETIFLLREDATPIKEEDNYPSIDAEEFWKDPAVNG